MSNHKGFGLARDREYRAMDVLADVVLGVQPFNPSEHPDEARQFGYLASLAKGGAYDNGKRLAAFSKSCREVVSSSAASIESASNLVDAVQASWGAAWHMDASKLRRELPLHVMKKKRLLSSDASHVVRVRQVEAGVPA